jgi:hypothetical protein
LLSVTLLNAVAGHEPESIAGLASLHRSRCAGEFIKQGRIAVFVTDTVALKNYSAFKLTARVPEWQLGALLNADLKDQADVACRARLLSTASDLMPLLDAGLIPASSLSQLVPLLEECGLRGRILLNLALADWTRH